MSTLVCLIIVFSTVVSFTNGQNYVCDDDQKNMAVCECTDDVCYFKLVIEHLQTFTAYEKEAPMGTRGRIFYINTMNELSPTRMRDNLPCNDRDTCTDPNTVDGSTYRSFISVTNKSRAPLLLLTKVLPWWWMWSTAWLLRRPLFTGMEYTS